MTIRNESSNETVDILVIGAGASGGAATAWLAEAGFKVKCLEQGYWLIGLPIRTCGSAPKIIQLTIRILRLRR